MDAKAITEKSKELAKAVSSNASPEIVTRILNELKRGVVPTEEILRSTRIGVTVNKLKGYKNRDVATLASEIIRKWRDEVEAKRDKNGPKRSMNSPSGTASPAPGQETPKQQSLQVSTPPTPNVPLDKRNKTTDKIEVKPTNNAVRDRCAGLLYDGLAFMSPDPPKTILSVATAIEASIHSKFGPEKNPAYGNKVRSLFQNLKNKSSGGLRADLLSGATSPEKFITLSQEELKSAERKAEDKKLEKENMMAAQAPQDEKSVSSSLQCSKCKKFRVSYSQAQTRSADEPMTTFCECLNCGKRWKVSQSSSASAVLGRLVQAC